MYFEIIGEISAIQTIATGTSIREIKRLKKFYGTGRWKKMKGYAAVRLSDQSLCLAEIHWYEAHGVGRKEIKIKEILRELK